MRRYTERMKNLIISILLLGIVALGVYAFYQKVGTDVATKNTSETTPPPVSETTAAPTTPLEESIGTSVEGRDIVAYHFGTGSKEVVFVGGIHGGYEWNTALVAGALVDYLKAHPSAVPAGEKVTVIPVVNPDGLYKVVGTSTTNFTASDVNSSQSKQIAGRFNANKVDLNRNFDCDWKSQGVWQSQTVSGGSAAFSEPESKAAEMYINAHHPAAAVLWFSSAGGVYASSCGGGILPETHTLTDLYASASGYPAYESFDAYATNGDMANWLAKMQIPAISVLLTTHTDTEWDKNWSGVKAILDHYAQ